MTKPAAAAAGNVTTPFINADSFVRQTMSGALPRMVRRPRPNISLTLTKSQRTRERSLFASREDAVLCLHDTVFLRDM